MIEPRTSNTFAEAHRRAHMERGEAFNQMFRAVPRLIKSIRIRA